MTNYDWVRWLFQIIPDWVKVIEPKPSDQENICKGLHVLHDALRDAEGVHAKKWMFVKETDECGYFTMGSKKIYWWLDPEKAMLVTPDIDSVKFKNWCVAEYKRLLNV